MPGMGVSISGISTQLETDVSVRVEPRILERYNPKMCPHCKTETMINLEILTKRGPPKHAELMENARLNLKK